MPAGFKILISKNIKFETRDWWRFVAEVIIVIVCFVTVALNPVHKRTDFTINAEVANKTQTYTFPIDSFKYPREFVKNTKFIVSYTPSGKYFKKLMTRVKKALGLDGVKAFHNETDMMDLFNPSVNFAAVVFENTTKKGNLPRLHVKIRFPYQFRTFKDKNILSNNYWVTRCSGVLTPGTEEKLRIDLYMREGFLQLQHQIFIEWFNKEFNNSKEVRGTFLTSFRQKTNKEVCRVEGSSNLTMFLYSFSFLLPFLNLIWHYGREREENIPAHHWRYGYTLREYWLSHYVVSFVHLLILDFIIVVLLKVPFRKDEYTGGFLKTPFYYLVLFLCIYNMSLMVCAVLIVLILPIARDAVLLGATVWLCSYALFSIVIEYSDTKMDGKLILTFLLFFNNGFSWGMRHLKAIETLPDESQVWILMAVMAGAGFLSLFLISVVNFANPGRYFTCMPYEFLWFKCGREPKILSSSKKMVIVSDYTPGVDNFEYGPLNGTQMVKFKDVCTFRPGTGKYLLKMVNVRMFTGEITVLLGPHCSGKTTFISLLAGWKHPQNGSVTIDERDVSRHFDETSGRCDVCMPNNPLFDYLTVEETLAYFTQTKMGEIDDEKVEMELDKWFEYMKPAKIDPDATVSSLSFEHKRIVSLCCTLTADTEIVLLDEPTLHMRSPEQHLYWSILQKEKMNRLIVVATFDAEEAETIGDRIAVINDGLLRAYGTPHFLRAKFNSGCDLIILKNSKMASEPITDVIRRFIPEIIPDNEIGDQLTYKLPVSRRRDFQHLLITIDQERSRLGIEDVRLLSSELNEMSSMLDKHQFNQVISNEEKHAMNLLTENELGSQQTWGMLFKKLVHQAPNAMPILICGFCFVFIILVAEMSEVLRSSQTDGNVVNLGFQGSRAFMPNVTCTGVEIVRVARLTRSATNKDNGNSMIFLKNSLKCYKDPYLTEITTKKQYVYQKIGAVEYNDSTNSIDVFCNERVFHSAAASLNLAHNMLLSSVSAPDEMVVSIVNQPMNLPLRTKINLLDQQMMHLVLPMVLGVVVPMSVACFIIPLAEERRHHLMQLQIMTNVGRVRYWIVTLLWDYATYLTFTMSFVIVMALCSLEGLGFSGKMHTMMLMNVYGVAGLLMVYVLSLFFYASTWSAFLIAVLAQVITGIVSYVFYWDVIDNHETFFYIWSIFPAFAMLDGISNIYTQTAENKYCEERCSRKTECNRFNMCKMIPQCCGETFYKFSDPGILLSIVYMLGSAVLFFLLLLVLENHLRKRKFSTNIDVKSCRTACYSYDDRDVVAVRKKIAEQDLRHSLRKHMMVDQLEYELKKKTRDLRTVSFLVDKGMCLGIYGTRCSGKSHLLRQLIGEHGFSFGDVFVNRHEVKTELEQAHKVISYAPEQYGLFYDFTMRELLRFFCMMRGVPPKDVNEVIIDLAMTFDMRMFLDRPIRQLTVGRQRKVSIAIAMIPPCKIIFLDEPTRGLSAHTCREIWNIIRFKRFMGKTIIFTTSDASELDALADQVILIDEGEMWAIGSSHFLRQKYTRGFYLEIKLKRDGMTAEEASENFHKDSENLQRFITFLHAESELQFRIDSWFKFYLPVPKINYSYLYGALEKNKRRLNIVDYMIRQGSMKNVMVMIYNIRKHRNRLEPDDEERESSP